MFRVTIQYEVDDFFCTEKKSFGATLTQEEIDSLQHDRQFHKQFEFSGKKFQILSKQPYLAKRLSVKYKVNGIANSHGGYCSGNECELIEYNDYESSFEAPYSDLEDFSDEETFCKRKFHKQLERKRMEYESEYGSQSGYCTNSQESEAKGFGNHDSTVVISNFEIIIRESEPAIS